MSEIICKNCPKYDARTLCMPFKTKSFQEMSETIIINYSASVDRLRNVRTWTVLRAQQLG